MVITAIVLENFHGETIYSRSGVYGVERLG